MIPVLNRITAIHPLGAEAIDQLSGCLVQLAMTKGDYLVKEGRVCRMLYFVEVGALRGYYNLDGKQVTHWFGFENDFVTSFHSFITGRPAIENIQLMESSVLWSISKEDLHRLMMEHPDVERLVRLTYEQYYIRLEERFVTSHFKSATERYAELLQRSPHIIGRVPLGTIASFLGISQETLSRIRAKR